MIAEIHLIRGAPKEIYGTVTYLFYLRILWFVRPCHHDMVRSHVEDGETVCRHGEYLRIYQLNSPGQKSNCDTTALCLCEVLTNSKLKKLQCCHVLHNAFVAAILNKVMKLPFQQIRGVPRIHRMLFATV
jgi:hypothetical protein